MSLAIVPKAEESDPAGTEPAPARPVDGRLQVLLLARDPVYRAGIGSHLLASGRAQPIDPGPGRRADVAVVVSDRIDDEVLRVVAAVRRQHGIAVALVSSHLDPDTTAGARRAGAGAFLLRSDVNPGRLASMLASLCQHPAGSGLAGRVGGSGPGRDGVAGRDTAPAQPARDTTPGWDTAQSLSARDVAVLRLLSEGCDTAEIAGHLGYSEPTIKNAIQRLFGRLEARNRPHAVAVALRIGVI